MAAEETQHSEAEASGQAADARAAGAVPAGGAVVAAVAGLAAAWVVGGSAGLLDRPLQNALTWVLLGVAVVGDWQGRARRLPALPLALLAAAAAIAATAFRVPAVSVLGVALVLALLCLGRRGPSRSALLAASLAVAAQGMYQFARTSIPQVWYAADRAGWAMGHVVGEMVGKPLRVGASFAGLDFLVPMAVLYAAWLAWTAPRRRARAAFGALAIVAAHLLYLVVVALLPRLLELLAVPPPPPPDPLTGEPAKVAWSLTAAVRTLLPWNLPALACVLHAAVAAAMLRWAAWPGETREDEAEATRAAVALRLALAALGVVAAVALPALTVATWGKADPTGKKIVFFEEGFLNWERPRHGEYGFMSGGMYGMLPPYVESLGARCVISADLSQEDLEGAAVVVVIYPDRGLPPARIERLWDFAKGGGSLLVFGEHTVGESTDSYAGIPTGPRFNEVLKPTAMGVEFDSATYGLVGWQRGFEALAHPTTAGIGNDRNQFGVTIGASLWARWPARPLVVGKWGWSDPGDKGRKAHALMGNSRYDPGEKLGDVILVAEEPLGDGRIVAFGDTTSIGNMVTPGTHGFTSRLFAYLAAPPRRVQAPGILLAGLFACLAVALSWRPDRLRVALVALALGYSLVVCTRVSQKACLVCPDGRPPSGEAGACAMRLLPELTGNPLLALARPGREADGGYTWPNRLAYIDASHVEAYDGWSERPDGTMGLSLTLMRSGYLTLRLGELTAERLKRAGLVVSVAPARELTEAEREAVGQFVTEGGIFILTVGYEESGPSQSLLSDFGFHFGGASTEHFLWRAAQLTARLTSRVSADAFHFGGMPAWTLVPFAVADGPCMPVGDPVPMGHFKSDYINPKGYMRYVRFQAAWPIGCTDPTAEVIALGRDGALPVILVRKVGEGKFVLIGDTGFAMNKNLENEHGEPFDGMYENAEFWRWFLTHLRDEAEWVPPPPPPPPPQEPQEPAEEEPIEPEAGEGEP